MRDHHADAVRAALRELRADDESRAPRYNDVLMRARAAYRVDISRVAGLATAAVALVMAVAVARYALRPRLVVPGEVVALSSWRPMTDVLLEPPGWSALKQAPRLGASVLPSVHLDTSREQQ